MKLYHVRNNLNDLHKSWKNFDCGAVGGEIQCISPDKQKQGIFGSTHSKHVHPCEDLFAAMLLDWESRAALLPPVAIPHQSQFLLLGLRVRHAY